jgi:hypothetical protein
MPASDFEAHLEVVADRVHAGPGPRCLLQYRRPRLRGHKDARLWAYGARPVRPLGPRARLVARALREVVGTVIAPSPRGYVTAEAAPPRAKKVRRERPLQTLRHPLIRALAQVVAARADETTMPIAVGTRSGRTADGRRSGAGTRPAPVRTPCLEWSKPSLAPAARPVETAGPKQPRQR